MLNRPKGVQILQAPANIRIPAKSPYNGSDDAELIVSRAMLIDLEKQGPTRKFYDAQLISETVESPVVILEGLNRTGFQSGYCYSRIPTCRWVDEQTKADAPVGRVFVVFVMPANHGLCVLDWEWRLEDEANAGYPRYWKSDYTRQIWPPMN
jgi:hypothetical protein